MHSELMGSENQHSTELCLLFRPVTSSCLLSQYYSDKQPSNIYHLLLSQTTKWRTLTKYLSITINIWIYKWRVIIIEKEILFNFLVQNFSYVFMLKIMTKYVECNLIKPYLKFLVQLFSMPPKLDSYSYRVSH